MSIFSVFSPKLFKKGMLVNEIPPAGSGGGAISNCTDVMACPGIVALQTSVNNAWLVGGNFLTATGKLGTTNGRSVAFITNNIQRAIISSNGTIGIGSNFSSTEQLKVVAVSTNTALSLTANGLPNYALKVYAGRIYADIFNSVSDYADNATAIAAGLVAGDFYRTGGDPDLLAIVH